MMCTNEIIKNEMFCNEILDVRLVNMVNVYGNLRYFRTMVFSAQTSLFKIYFFFGSEIYHFIHTNHLLTTNIRF
jgi:hypothetical protein